MAEFSDESDALADAHVTLCYHRVFRTVATKSKREAKAAMATLEAAVAAGNVSFDDPTLASLLDRWNTSPACADTTLYHYLQYIGREIVPVLGSIRLSRLKGSTFSLVDHQVYCAVE